LAVSLVGNRGVSALADPGVETEAAAGDPAAEVEVAQQSGAAFISYASLENAVPDDRPSTGGFVTQLQRALFHELETELGMAGVLLWRDRTAIEPGDLWTDKIIEALRAADILIVILSPNYLKRPWCKKELETFASRLESSVDPDRAGRILRLDRVTMKDAEIPDLLRPVQAIRFFELDRLENDDKPYFWRGQVRDDRFYVAVRTLALQIARILRRQAASTRVKEPAPAPRVKANGRTVFVARPAADMEADYRRLCTELRGRGFTIEPSPESEPWTELADATSAIAAALARAELAVHLVGTRTGYMPESSDQAIVPLQLALSAQHMRRNETFERIIWSPAILPIDPGKGADKSVSAETDPQERLSRLGAKVQEHDSIDSGPFVDFCDNLVRRVLSRREKKAESRERTRDDSAPRVYILFHDSDEDFASEVAARIKQGGATVYLQPKDGEAQQQRALHAQRLAECRFVILCWRNASKTWVEATAAELTDGAQQGRGRSHLVILGGEPTSSKLAYSKIFPQDQIDKVVDGTADKLDGGISELVQSIGGGSR
jgi:hypothetical protein